MSSLPTTVTIRLAYPDDEATLWRLAALDSAALPRAPFLLAEVEGEVRAALSLGDGRAIADPFFPTLRLIAVLRAHAAATASERVPDRSRHRFRHLRLAAEY